jgi:ABC-type lipoprotein export system ATPase subunit
VPSFNIIKESKPNKSFRVSNVMGTFDLKSEKIIEKFKGSINIENIDWQIGLIVGASGTGKTTITKEIFGNSLFESFDYKERSFLDDFDNNLSSQEIFKMLNSVGLSSPPDWLKSYSVLSNGQKMRVDLARLLLKKDELVVFDEFTSVVDRDIAKIGSFATQKAIRRTDKKFIAVGCHYDVEDWLLPDWVFDTNTMTFEVKSKKKDRPPIKVEIFECKDAKRKSDYWKMFAKYHYLNHSFNKAAKVFIMKINDNIVGFCSALHFPHPKVKNIIKEHRSVLLPDYQGCGFGNFMSDFVASYFVDNNYRYRSVTSNPSMIFSRKRNKNWVLDRKGRLSKISRTSSIKEIGKSSSENRITTSWEYKNE